MPVLGSRPLTEITPRELYNFINDHLDHNAITTKKKYRKVLGNLFKSALSDRLISENPVSQMDGFTGKPGRAKAYLTTAQMSILLQYMKQNSHPYFLHVAVTALTGMRINEQAGFQFQDIVWGRDLILVRRVFNRKQGFREGTKFNQNSKTTAQRSVPLSPELKSILKAEFDLRKPKGEDVVLPPLRKWVTGEQGDILHSMLTLLDLPRITWYQLRHSFAAALADLNVPLKTISEVLGHSKIETTAIYLVNLGATVRGAADKLRLFPDLNLTDEGEEEN